MKWLRRIEIAGKALRELGPAALGLYACYQVGLRSGWLAWQTRRRSQPFLQLQELSGMPTVQSLRQVLGTQGLAALQQEADEIVAGQVRLFGEVAVPLRLTVPGPLAHWTAYESGRVRVPVEDIKFIWEPARFGWACTLGRAYYLTQDERYAQAFWENIELFWDANPACEGPNWTSAQEVALRLIAWVFAFSLVRGSRHSTLQRCDRLAQEIAVHAARIPPSLVYARSQRNNHLLTEAAGLYTAGVLLPEHPQASTWRSAGWRWFHAAVQDQIEMDGSYIQHSTNYHRLALQIALWMQCMAKLQADPFPGSTCTRLALATCWLRALMDPVSGSVPNLGPNDGAYILPLTVCPFTDYRPVLQAAIQAFTRDTGLEPGQWDELALWCMKALPAVAPPAVSETPDAPAVLRSAAGDAWAYLRAARFKSRPGHADQLHLDLWWRGMNIAQDAGTFRYNALPPWENALTGAHIHNTITVAGRDQMKRAGRFLYLDWAQADWQIDTGGGRVVLRAQHDGYRGFHVIHRREVECVQETWQVRDSLYFDPRARVKEAGRAAQWPVRLHWLLPDWPWAVKVLALGWQVCLGSPQGKVFLRLSVFPEAAEVARCLQVVRAGEVVYGSGPVLTAAGWAAPTYAVKVPALSVGMEVSGYLPLRLLSEWDFSGMEEEDAYSIDPPGLCRSG